MLFTILGIEQELTASDGAKAKQALQRMWLDWIKLNPIPDDITQRFGLLRRLFYQDMGFRGDWQQHYQSQCMLPTQLFSSKSGNATSLALLLRYFAAKLDIPCEFSNFPGQTLLRFELDLKVVYFDPFSNKELGYEQLESLYRGHEGNAARLENQSLTTLNNKQISQRWLEELKLAYLRESNYELALKVSHRLLEIKPGDPHEMRDRGFIYQQLECNSVAVNDFEYFIEQCPDDPLSKLLKAQISSLDSSPATLH